MGRRRRASATGGGPGGRRQPGQPGRLLEQQRPQRAGGEPQQEQPREPERQRRLPPRELARPPDAASSRRRRQRPRATILPEPAPPRRETRRAAEDTRGTARPLRPTPCRHYPPERDCFPAEARTVHCAQETLGSHTGASATWSRRPQTALPTLIKPTFMCRDVLTSPGQSRAASEEFALSARQYSPIIVAGEYPPEGTCRNSKANGRRCRLLTRAHPDPRR